MKRVHTLVGAAASLLAATWLSTGSAQAACNLGPSIKHVVHITFDNVHLRRDNPNVPSDLEQMPNLLNFVTQNGIITRNHHTPLISHSSLADRRLSRSPWRSGREQLWHLRAAEPAAPDRHRLQQLVPLLDLAVGRFCCGRRRPAEYAH